MPGMRGKPRHCLTASRVCRSAGAPKLINVYLKTAAYVGEFGRQGLRDVLHPPIDGGLWKGLKERFEDRPDILEKACYVEAIKDIDDYDRKYCTIIQGCKLAAQELGCLLIEVEQLWQGTVTPSGTEGSTE